MIVSFYTENWHYPYHADRLRKSLDRLKIPHDIQFIKGRGRWIDNTRLKALFIYDMLHTYKRFLWVDVDSIVDRNPFPAIFKSFTGDLLLRRHSTLNDRLYHVSVMGWNSNDKTKGLCKEWIQEGDEHVGTDELSLDCTIKTFNQSLSIHLLDPTYHCLPKEKVSNPYITIGLSTDPTKRSKPLCSL